MSQLRIELSPSSPTKTIRNWRSDENLLLVLMLPEEGQDKDEEATLPPVSSSEHYGGESQRKRSKGPAAKGVMDSLMSRYAIPSGGGSSEASSSGSKQPKRAANPFSRKSESKK